MEEDTMADDVNVEDRADRVVPLPAAMADALRIHLEADDRYE
jgi:hypothetical protein